MSWVWWVLAVVLWAGIGMVGVLVLLHRRGHRQGVWYLLGAVLGPLFVPIAWERARRHGALVEQQVDARSAASAGAAARGGSGPCVLVAVDGSPESEQALRDAERFVGEPADRIVLVTVVDADGCDGEQLARVRELLRRGADRLAGSGARIDTEVVSGQPAQALLERIEADEVDLVVAGRRGRGLSRALLGSVAEQLSTRSPVPVLLAAPVAVPADRPR